MKQILKLGSFLILLVMIFILFVFYSFYIEPKLLVVKEFDLIDKNSGEDIAVVQISDIHMKNAYNIDDLKKLVEKVNEQIPDLILFTGDLFDHYANDPIEDTVAEELSKLKSTYGKYAVWGNRDIGGGANRIYASLMEKAGFTILRNNSTRITLPNDKILFLSGLDDCLLGKPDISQIESEIGAYDYHILMVHEPDIVDELKELDIQLYLSGHSHGGQIRIPFMDIIMTDMAQKYKRGFYTIDEQKNTKLYVNTGIGTTKIAARFGVPPQIAIFKIRI